MSITWKYIKPLENDCAVKDFLSENQVILPEVLVNMLETCNGGRPSDKTIITDANREYVFKNLLSFNKGDIETIYEVYPDLFGESALFPFGSDSAGNYICYNTKSQLYVLHNHEMDMIENIIVAPFLKCVMDSHCNEEK